MVLYKTNVADRVPPVFGYSHGKSETATEEPDTGKCGELLQVLVSLSGDERARTVNPRLAKPVLSQLSYVPKYW